MLSLVAMGMISGTCKNSSGNRKSDGAGTSQTFNLDTTKLKSGEVFYQCTMDPQVISDKPGVCPICEMDLSEMKKK